MFLNNLTTPDKEKVRDAVLVELENIGLKSDFPKKTIKHARRAESSGRVFRTSLDRLPTTGVRLRSGVEIAVPSFIREACHCILENVDVEGIFRKTGSAARQREIKALVESGHPISLREHHAIDIAGLLKLFLRELPESLVPTYWHDIFIRCLAFGGQTNAAILLTCLLLPPAHLASLAYFMQVLHEVASHAAINKMDKSNLAIILAPTVMPIQMPNRMDKAPATTIRLNNHLQIIEILINHAYHIGMVPAYVSGTIEPSSSSSSLTEGTSLRRSLTRSLKKRRRRSASLTRMLNGLRKIVGNRSPPDGASSEDEATATGVMSEFPTPCVKPCKKRKAQEVSTSGLSTKKKREVLELLPQSCPLADAPFTPARTSGMGSNGTPAVSIDPSPTRADTSTSPLKLRKKRFFGGRSTSESEKSSKKSLLSMGGKVTKKNKRSDGGKESHGGGFLERSWSAVSNTSNWGRRKLSRISLLSTSAATSVDTDSETLVDMDSGDIGVDLSLSQNVTAPNTPASPPVVCLSARQYADIERRMSDIETRLSTEMKHIVKSVHSAAAGTGSPEPLRAADTAQAVQTVYQRTLQGSERLVDSATDELARRLGQQLKIRRKSETRVIRSPSARKIGTIRRELRRNKSWHTLHNTGAGSAGHLRRGRPNTVASGLPQHAPSRVARPIMSTLGTNSPARQVGQPGSTPDPNMVGLPSPTPTPKRASSFHVAETANSFPPPSAKFSSQVDIAKQVLSSSTEDMWYDAVEHLGRLRPRPLTQIDRRDSVARLRSENAGMVLAKARLFGAATAPSRARPLASHPPQPKLGAPTQTNEPASTPRRQTPLQPTSADQVSIRTLRPRPSPPVTALENEARRVKKHSSLKVDRSGLTHPVRRNLSTPNHWPDAAKDKENRVGKASPGQNIASPLRDANRLLSTTPAPTIKAPLGTSLPHRVIATPRSGVRGRPTPLRALATPTGISSPRHRSPRVAMGARALLARSRQGRVSTMVHVNL